MPPKLTVKNEEIKCSLFIISPLSRFDCARSIREKNCNVTNHSGILPFFIYSSNHQTGAWLGNMPNLKRTHPIDQLDCEGGSMKQDRSFERKS
jgi:hypothetical protein